MLTPRPACLGPRPACLGPRVSLDNHSLSRGRTHNIHRGCGNLAWQHRPTEPRIPRYGCTGKIDSRKLYDLPQLYRKLVEIAG
jgi:hypothetical protein